MRIKDATVVVERNRPEYRFPREWKYAFYDEEEMREQTDHLRWFTMRDKYGWGMIAGVTSSSLYLRPDVECARRSNAINRKDILKSGVMGVHMFGNRDEAKEYFKKCYVLEEIEIEQHEVSSVPSVTDSTPTSNNVRHVYRAELEPSDTSANDGVVRTFDEASSKQEIKDRERNRDIELLEIDKEANKAKKKARQVRHC